MQLVPRRYYCMLLPRQRVRFRVNNDIIIIIMHRDKVFYILCACVCARVRALSRFPLNEKLVHNILHMSIKLNRRIVVT